MECCLEDFNVRVCISDAGADNRIFCHAECRRVARNLGSAPRLISRAVHAVHGFSRLHALPHGRPTLVLRWPRLVADCDGQRRMLHPSDEQNRAGDGGECGIGHFRLLLALRDTGPAVACACQCICKPSTSYCRPLERSGARGIECPPKMCRPSGSCPPDPAGDGPVIDAPKAALAPGVNLDTDAFWATSIFPLLTQGTPSTADTNPVMVLR